jgi:predicted metalloprotease with PDZ domain
MTYIVREAQEAVGRMLSTIGMTVEVSKEWPGEMTVVEVQTDGPAASAGLVVGEHILGVNGVVIESCEAFSELIRSTRPGGTLALQVAMRTHTGMKTKMMLVTIGATGYYLCQVQALQRLANRTAADLLDVGGDQLFQFHAEQRAGLMATMGQMPHLLVDDGLKTPQKLDCELELDTTPTP